MIDVGFVLFAAPFGIISVGAILLYLRDRPEARIKRALRRTRATSIAGARDGEVVKIIGTVRYGNRTATSPLTARACAAYSVVVDKQTNSLPNEILREDGGTDFYVEDGSGAALVRIGDVAPSIALVRDREFDTTPLDSNAVIERFLTAHGKSVRGIVFYKSLQAREGIVAAGMRVAVLGLARWVPDPDAAGGSYRETPRRLVLEGSEAVPLLVSNVPNVVR